MEFPGTDLYLYWTGKEMETGEDILDWLAKEIFPSAPREIEDIVGELRIPSLPFIRNDAAQLQPGFCLRET